MRKEKQIKLCILLLIIGIVAFTLQVFVFSYPDGVIGFFMVLTSIYLIMGSTIKLCILSKKFKNNLLTYLDLLFFIN